MSTEALRFVRSLPEGDGPGKVPKCARKTLHAMAGFMFHQPGKEGHGICYASQATIGKSIGIKSRQVREHQKKLEASGIIYRVERSCRRRQGRGGASISWGIRAYSDFKGMIVIDQAAERSKKIADDSLPNGCSGVTNRQNTEYQPAPPADNTKYKSKENPIGPRLVGRLVGLGGISSSGHLQRRSGARRTPAQSDSKIVAKLAAPSESLMSSNLVRSTAGRRKKTISN